MENNLVERDPLTELIESSSDIVEDSQDQEDVVDSDLNEYIRSKSIPVGDEQKEMTEMPEYAPLEERDRFADLPTGETIGKEIDPALREILQQSRPDEIIDYFINNKLSDRKKKDLKNLRAKGRVNGRAFVTLPQALKDINSIALKPESIEPQSWGNVFKRALKNTPRSSTQLIKDIIAPFLSPAETAEAMYRLSKGIGQKLIPGIQEDEYLVNSLVDMFKTRYGGIDNFKETLATDPAGVAADISTFLLGAGFATRVAAKAGKISKLQKTGEVLKKAGESIEPLTAITRGTKKVVKTLIPKEMPSKLYEHAVKFSIKLPRKTRNKLTKIALAERTMPTVKGLDKLQEKINVLNKEIAKIMDIATAEGRKIPTRVIFRHLRELKKQKLLGGDARSDIRQINSIMKDIVWANKQIRKEKYFTPSELQTIKQSLYKKTKKLYTQISEKPIKGEARQQLARGIKDALEIMGPEVKQLNKRDSNLLALHEEMEKVVARLTGQDLMNFRTSIQPSRKFSIVPYITLGLIGTPKVKAKLAIVAESLKQKGVVLDPDSILSQVLAKTPKAVPLTLRGVTQATKNGSKTTKNGAKK
jgi:hypothetical protein